MKSRSLKLFAASIVTAFAVGAEANAGCSSASLVGKWYGPLSTVNAPVSGNNYTGYCEITITKSNVPDMIGTCTAVSSNPNIDKVVDHITAQSLVVGKDCSITGTITSSLGGSTEIHGHVNVSKNVFVAATKNSTGGVGSLNFVK